jgi:hypothetical protein
VTLLIGADLGNYTIIAADTRTWWKQWFSHNYRDGDHKIIMCDLMLITGAGYLDALESVKKELLDKEINHTDDVLEIIKNQALPKVEELRLNNPTIKESVCVMISYITIHDNKPLLRLSLVHQKWGYQLVHFNDAIVVMPSDSSEEESERYTMFLQKNLSKADENIFINTKLLEKNMSDNIGLIVKCFFEISKKSTLVSNDVDFAILLINGTILYGYCEYSNAENITFKISTVPRSKKTCILTPDVTQNSL